MSKRANQHRNDLGGVHKQRSIDISGRTNKLTDENVTLQSDASISYRVFLKKVSFGNFRTMLVSEEEINLAIESKDKGLSLGKFS